MVSLARPRLYAVLLGTFAVFGLAVVAAGLFGVLSGQTAVVTGAGLCVGLVAAGLLTTYLSKLLYGVRPSDALAFVTVALVVALTAAIASIVPARRSARIDPLSILRS